MLIWDANDLIGALEQRIDEHFKGAEHVACKRLADECDEDSVCQVQDEIDSFVAAVAYRATDVGVSHEHKPENGAKRVVVQIGWRATLKRAQ